MWIKEIKKQSQNMIYNKLKEMKIYTTKKSIIEWEKLTRYFVEKLLKYWIIKTVVNNKWKKLGYYLVR